MRTHNKIKGVERNKKCEICDFETHKTYDLKKHQKVHEKEPSDHIAVQTCSECDKTFETKKTLIAHNKTHTKENRVQCLICEKSFSHKGNLLKHNSTQHQSKKVKTNLGFGRWEESGQTNNTNGNIKNCSLCAYTSKHSQNLRKHIETIHFKDKAPIVDKCDKCDYTSDKPYYVQRHMAEVKHRKVPSKSSKC